MKLTFITGNAGKFKELAAIIPGLTQLKVDLDEIQSLHPRTIIEHKLNQAAQNHDSAFIVEDTSLVFSCLGELPGALIRWFEDSLGNNRLADLVHRYDDHTAIACSTIGYRDQTGGLHYFTGQIKGVIVQPRGTVNPFGWNTIFMPDGSSETFAEMSLETKNTMSMRGQAARQLLAFLKTQ